jgi:hypothetical protein
LPVVVQSFNRSFLLRSFRDDAFSDESFAPVPSGKLTANREDDSMPHEILESMRALREDMRQRMLQVPEYRALVALDRSIDELCAILQEAMTPQQMQPAAPHSAMTSHMASAERAPMPAPMPSPMAPPMQMAEPAQHRATGIASAFAETLAAKIDQRNLARAASPYLPNHRVSGN